MVKVRGRDAGLQVSPAELHLKYSTVGVSLVFGPLSLDFVTVLIISCRILEFVSKLAPGTGIQ